MVTAAFIGACTAAPASTSQPTHSLPTTSPTATAVATLPPLTETFESPMMGYSVAYPAGWTPTPATELWIPTAGNYWDDPVGDRLEDGTAGFRGTSQPLAKGQSAKQWLKHYFGSAPACGDEGEKVPVGDAMGTIGLNGCDGLGRLGGKVFDLAVVSGGRGYNFTMEGEVTHELFLAMLATVDFEPKRAKLP